MPIDPRLHRRSSTTQSAGDDDFAAAGSSVIPPRVPAVPRRGYARSPEETKSFRFQARPMIAGAVCREASIDHTAVH